MRPNADASRSNRRDFLASGLALAGTLALGRNALARTFHEGEYGPLKVGIQSYSLRHFKFEEALARTRELGLHYWESYNAHIPTADDSAKIGEARKLAEAAQVKVIGYGVVHFGKDIDANRKTFEFAKALGVDYISADPDPDSFDNLDTLVEEYKIGVGIHPHGPGHRYNTLDIVEKAIKGHSDWIGLCNDTGHLLRSNQDPVEAIHRFAKRTYGVHLKDVKDAKTFTILGEGDLKLAEYVQALAKVKYPYCVALEYEENPEHPMADIKACLDNLRKATATIKGA
ncbi:sugar phosphate isomerase/epimerase [Isosphaeraceae bacterium EP7]